jgi:hypothetical protein
MAKSGEVGKLRVDERYRLVRDEIAAKTVHGNTHRRREQTRSRA